MTRSGAAGSEFDLIGHILAARTVVPPGVAVDAGDDCAVVDAGPLATSVDLSVEGVHFRRDWLSPAEIGHRAAVAALSDLAAVAADPVGVYLALCVGEAWGATEALELAEGVIGAAESLGAGLLGGDVSRGPVTVLDIVATGRCDEPVLRSGARPGDALWVTGTLGGAAAAVAAWESGRTPEAAARRAFARPVPRVREAHALRAAGARALIDLSDGLAGDAAHVARASGVALVLDAAEIPVHPAATLEDALHGGEDYELLVALPVHGGNEEVPRPPEAGGAPLTRVGVVRAGEGVYLRGSDGEERPLQRGGYDHLEASTA